MDNTDRPVLSQSAIDALRRELEELKTEGRDRMSERLKAAREHGDVTDNSEYESAKQDQALLEGRIQKVEHILRQAIVRETPADASAVVVGTMVTVRDTDAPQEEDRYLVGESEERLTGARVLSPQSPLGKALLGCKIGDKVTYDAPGGSFTYEVVKIEPA